VVAGLAHHHVGGAGEARHAPLIDPVEVGGAALLDEYEPGLGQDSQVGGDGRLPDRNLADDLPDGHRAAMLGEQVEVSLAIPSCANIAPWRC
jgi:hypothetical protein